ncbi:MAG: hypothetical protein ABIQ88_06130 [Chitinophagaceae bacterium]
MINDILQLLGMANLQLSKYWTANGDGAPSTLPALADDKFTLDCGAGDGWVAPCSGILTENQHHLLLQNPDGSTPSAGIVLQMPPQVYLAISRLYGSIIEGKPVTSSGSPDRPVPKYFLYSDITKLTADGPQPGIFNAGDKLDLRGKLTIHDEEGLVIDPLAVANAFDSFLQTHWSMEKKAIGSPAPGGATPRPFSQPTTRQIFNMAESGDTRQKIYFTDIYNAPVVPTEFGNISVFAGSLFALTAIAPITKNAGAAALLQLAVSTNGIFANTLSYPAAAVNPVLKHDFIRVKIVNWADHLIGDAPADEPTKVHNVLPEIRDNEQISFCFTGNECLGHVNNIMSGAAVEKTIVSADIQTDFSLPPLPASANHQWPAFPAANTPDNTPIPANLDKILAKAAHFITDAVANNTGVYLQLSNPALQNGWAVRVYHRVFHADGTETRGDGAGTIVKNNTAAFLLKDPLGINRPFTTGIVLPQNPFLYVDMVIVNGAVPFQSRRYGVMVTKILPPAVLSAGEIAALTVETNTLNTITNTGISPSGFLGVKTSANPIAAITNVSAFLLASGTAPNVQPCLSPVLPTQSRLEGIAAGKNGTDWLALQSGLRMIKESRENFLTVGNPGSPGGADMHTTGLLTSGGRLAYDIARAALRRTRHLSERMKRLISDSDYVVPAVPGAAGRNFIGALLQTVAKKTESPRLEEFQQTLTNLPATAADLATQINQLVTSNTQPGWLPDSLKDQFKTAMTGITVTAANSQLAQEELKREYVSSLFGRRDSLHAVTKAITSARHFIYIEGSFFGPTKYPAAAGGDPPAEDLLEMILTQLKAKPGLKLMLCLAQEIPFNRGYDNVARFHKTNRNNAILHLLGAQDPTTHRYERQDQVIAFHPLGFPGRPVKMSTQTIIVDDVWAMMGSSNFSQRGFFFDGSADIVCCDKRMKNGKSLAIAALRRSLMLQYLRMDNALPNMPASNQVFLQNGRSAFEMLRALIDGGGGAMIRGFVPADTTGIGAAELTALQNIADPKGDTFYQAQAVLSTWLTALSTVPE